MSNSRGSLTVIARRSWRSDEPTERDAPALGQEIGDHRDEATPFRERPDPVERVRRDRPDPARSTSGGRGERRQDGPHLIRSVAGRDHVDARPGDQHRAESVLVACGEEADRRGSRHGDLRLLVRHRAEPHRRRRVDDEPRRQVAVGDLLADVGLASCAPTRSSRSGARRRRAGTAATRRARCRDQG